MLTGHVLFRTWSEEGFDKTDNHLAQIVNLLGEFPADLLEKSELSGKYFDPQGLNNQIFLRVLTSKETFDA